MQQKIFISFKMQNEQDNTKIVFLCDLSIIITNFPLHLLSTICTYPYFLW